MLPILSNGETSYCRVLIDSGSQNNLFLDYLVKRLGLRLRKNQMGIFGLGANDKLQHRESTDFFLTPKSETAFSKRAFVTSKFKIH